MSSVLEQLKENYIFAVIRGKSSDEAIEISKHSVLGGIKNIEVTYTTPEASKAITELKALYAKKIRSCHWCWNDYDSRVG